MCHWLDVANNYLVCVCWWVCLYRPVLAKAVHSLSRIGDELYVEPQEDGVSCSDTDLHTITSSYNADRLVASCGCTLCVNEKSWFVGLSLSLSLSCRSWPCGLWTPLGRLMLASCSHHSSSAGADYMPVFINGIFVWEKKKACIWVNFCLLYLCFSVQVLHY